MSQLEEVKKIIKALVIPHQNGLSAIALNNEFYEMEGRHVPWQSFGAVSLNEFLLSLNDILVFGPNKAGARVFFPKTDETTAHIEKFVSQQKPQPLKRRNEIFRYEVEKRPYIEPIPEPSRISPPNNCNLPESNQKFRNPSPPPPDPRNMLFRSSSPEKSKLKRPSPQDSPPKDPYEESLRRARERRGIARRNHRSKRSRSRSLSPRRTRSPSPKRNSSSNNRQMSSPNQRRQRSPSPKRGNSPVQRRQRSPSPWRGSSPVQRRPRSPSPRWGSSPVQRRQRSPSPRRGSSPIQRRPRSPSPRRGSSPVHRRQRSPSPRRGGSPVYRRQRSPSPRRGISPVQRRPRSPPPRKIQTKSISCQTDFEKVSKSCQTDVSNTHCISCQNNSKSHVPNGNHPRPTNNVHNPRQDYSNADENVDLNQLYYGTDYNVAPAFQCLYNPYSIAPVLDPSFEEDTAHTEPGFYYDFDAGVHKPIPRIPEYYAYWIMAGWVPAVQDSTPQVNHAQALPSSQSADPRVIPPPAKNAKVRDPRLARSEARISPAEKVAAKRKSMSLDDYKNLRKLGSNEQSDKSAVIVNEETIDTFVSEPVSTTEPVAKLPRDPRLRRAVNK